MSERQPADRTYESRGVSADKRDVKNALRFTDPGLFPGAFCKVVPDVLAGSGDHCVLLHADGAGTKSALAYIHYRRYGDPHVFAGIAQDSLVMNLDDLLCVGCTGPFLLSNTIGRNAKLIPGEVVAEIIRGYQQVADDLRQYDISIVPCGGETADVGDLVRTVVVDATLAARMRRDDVIDCSRVRPGHVIVGLASFGRAAWEPAENSGIGTNGFTAARHELLAAKFRAEFPETFAPDIFDLAYRGRFDLDDPLPHSAMTIGEALLSPTRTYAPVVREVLTACRTQISALFHNTGGGQTKCLGFGRNVRYVKNNLFPLPPIFRFLREVTGLPLSEMSRVFNLGHRLEIVCDPSASQSVIAIAQRAAIAAQVIGVVEPAESGRSLVLQADGETVEFQA
ncbi:MAG TPA: AIR synthase related protein [Candidatus Margulisiibacteriota bacterium]|nr:AIR synthase related protein [Candidatus Margulisiibacteriota bacterium]